MLYNRKVRGGTVRYIFKKDHSGNSGDPDRTHGEYVRDACDAEESGRITNGVKGLTLLAHGFPGFDCVWNFPAEYMHCVAIGVTKQLWGEWCSRLKPAMRHAIDDRLISIRPPSDMFKISKILKKKADWKASDWLYCLLF